MISSIGLSVSLLSKVRDAVRDCDQKPLRRLINHVINTPSRAPLPLVVVLATETALAQLRLYVFAVGELMCTPFSLCPGGCFESFGKGRTFL